MQTFRKLQFQLVPIRHVLSVSRDMGKLPLRRIVYIIFVSEVSAEAQGEPMRLDGVQVADELRRLRAVEAVADAGAAASNGGQHNF